MSHYKSILRATEYAITTKEYIYQMKPDRNLNRPWEIFGYSDTDYTVDNGTWRIVTGYIIIINIFFIAW